MSAAEWSKIEAEARNAGVDKFLSKPLFPSSIADILNECFDISEKQLDNNDAGTFEGRCILLADDVEINREIVVSLLEPTLIKIDCASNGVEAVRMFNEAPDKYDMIFMDVQMPEMDGYEATQRIRVMNNSRAKAIPIVAMTANVFREDIEKCLAAGMNDHIGKPINLAELRQKLDKFII